MKQAGDWGSVALAVLIALVAVLGLVAFFWLVGQAVAQGLVAPAPCDQSAPCLRQRVRDLRDYRDFLEDQLALAKALNQGLQAQIAARDADLRSCRAPTLPIPKDLPPRESPK